MSIPKDFFVGWHDKMPPKSSRLLKLLLVPLLILLPVFTLIVIYPVQSFNNHQFEFGKLTEVSGLYFHKPFPLIKVDESFLPDSLSSSILLVGFGKFGAERAMEEAGLNLKPFHAKRISLSGTLIYGDGKCLMELSEGASSVKHIESETTVINYHGIPENIALSGEILDPKCYFGVMKPGEGKIHKSCAIRCLSGGIMPIVRQVSSDKDKSEYFVLLGEQGEKINKDILPFVGESITLNGKGIRFFDWRVLFVLPENIQRTGN